MKHWAAPLIGKPYRSGAAGPDAFDCIGLVRYYFQERYGLKLPDYKVTEGLGPLLAFARATGWRRLATKPAENNLVLMENLQGRHIGVMVRCTEGLGLLHSQGTDQAGCVVWQPLNSLFGYRNFETWGNTECN